MFKLWPSALTAVVLHLSPTECASSYPDTQLAGLEALYDATNGQGWKTSTGWRDPVVNICSWYGVICDGDSGNVTGLSLSSNDLLGDISEATALMYVSSLKEIDLSDNQLHGPVPLVLGLMASLEKLDLSGNELSYFPATWGSDASALQHLSLQNNRISGSLPSAWLELNASSSESAFGTVYLQPTSSWLPELRSLLLGGNTINDTGDAVLQTVANWKSLQTLDLSNNALTGSVEDTLASYFFCDGSGGSRCEGYLSGVAAPLLRILRLDGNDLQGNLPQILDSGERRIDVLDVSGNRAITGAVPASYSKLLLLFAENTSLSGPELPAFFDVAASTSADAWRREATEHNLSVCPGLQTSEDENIVAATLDSGYDDYSLCACSDGFEGSGASCSECPLGTYRSVDDGEGSPKGGACLACPPNSTTLSRGRWLKSQCLCAVNFYDLQGGAGSGPSCSACPPGSRTLTAGATSIASCECEPGHFLNSTSGACEGCAAGTYKPAHGAEIGLCLPCPAGFYSEVIGATSLSECDACPLGFYGDLLGASSADNCTECPAGTYGAAQGITSAGLCTACWPGYYSESSGAAGHSTCIECPSNHSQPIFAATSPWDCIPCSDNQVANRGSAACTDEVTDDGTLIGLYLLIVGIILVVLTLFGVFLQKHCGASIPVTEKVHMKLNEEMKKFIYGQQFWISLFSAVEIMDLMSDLGAYASLMYTAALTGALKVVYTIVVAFIVVASLHGVHTRAMIILDMQEERTHGLAITGNNMLYYEKQFTLLQIMAQKRTCRIHVPFDRGNKYLSHHIGVQRLLSLNSMRIVIAVFEDVPFLSLNMFLLITQPELASNTVFMLSFVTSIFVLGYKMTLLEKHARLQIRKWNLEARMDTDTMLNKKAARGRRFSWACLQCEDEGVTPEALKETARTFAAQSATGAGVQTTGRTTPVASAADGGSPARDKRGTTPSVEYDKNVENIGGNNNGCNHTPVDDSDDGEHQDKREEGNGVGSVTVEARNSSVGGYSRADRGRNAWKMFRGSAHGAGNTSNGKVDDGSRNVRRSGRIKKILPSEGGFGDDSYAGEAATDPLVPRDLPSSTHPTAGGLAPTIGYVDGDGKDG